MLKKLLLYILLLPISSLCIGTGTLNAKWVKYHRCQCNYCYTFSTNKNPACWCSTRTCKCAHCRDIVRGRTN